MKRLNGLITTAVVALISAAGTDASAQPAQVRTPAAERPPAVRASVPQMARLEAGSLHGLVRDETGVPVEGATVSAIGATMVFAVTDSRGRFAFENLPAGQYLVRANRAGFSLAQREYVQVRGSARVVKWLELHRTGPVGTAGTAIQPRILAAGLSGDPVAQPEEATADGTSAVSADPSSPHPHTEAAWRLRHVRRSVLKEATEIVTVTENQGTSDAADYAEGSSYASLFAALPFSGEINLLTSGAFDRPGELFGGGLPRGITYVQLGNLATDAAGWTVQAAVSQGDVSSWIVAGSFSARGPRAHAFETGLSYGAQEYAGGNPAALAVRSDGSRRAGGVYGFDNWTISPGVHVSYGARVSRYDYVNRQNLWSPRVALSLNVADATHVRGSIAQRMRAPGAEEFLPPQTRGPWLPPERTFSPIGGDDFRVERIRQVELTFEREFQENALLSVRRFFERVDDQLVTIFGAQGSGRARADIGHYLVGTAGAVDADGWGVKLASSPTKRLRGAVDYSLTRARWAPDPAATGAVARLAPSTVRNEREDVHDVATSVEADITETATRVFFYYRVSTGYARDDDAAQAALGARFDLQVKQGLPFMPFRGSEWQVLVGIRDLFRDPLESASSTYDELLVVRPPKRVIGGVQVKF